MNKKTKLAIEKLEERNVDVAEMMDNSKEGYLIHYSVKSEDPQFLLYLLEKKCDINDQRGPKGQSHPFASFNFFYKLKNNKKLK